MDLQSTMPDFKLIKQEILTFLRANRSFKEMDRELALSNGSYKKWEESKITLAWEKFIAISRALKHPIAYHFCQAQAEDVKGLVEALLIGSTQQELCKKSQLSRSTLTRWLALEKGPSVEQTFQLLHFARNLFYQFVEQNWGLKNCPSLSDINEKYQATMQMNYQHPLGLMMRMFLMSDDFAAAPGASVPKLARAFEISEETAQEFIDHALKNELMMEQNGVYVPTGKSMVVRNFEQDNDIVVERMLNHWRFLSSRISAKSVQQGSFRASRITRLVNLEQYQRCVEIMRESFLELMNFLQPLPSAEHNPRPWIAMTSGFQLVNFSDMLVPSALNDKTPTPQSISGNCFELAPDYKQLKVELLQQILRKCSVSASEIDARLEQTPGTFEKWCKHELSISWPEFIRLNRAAGLEISFQVINGYADSDIADVVPFLNYLMSGVTQEEFCKRVDFSRAILNRWLAREVAPTVEQIFQILTLYRAYLFIFLKNNYAIEELNCLTKYREHMLKVHQACFDHPFGLQIISFMLSDAFERMSGSAVDRLARAFAMSPADAQDFLNIVLESKSVIEQSGKFSPYLIDLPIVFAPARPADTYNRVQQNLKFLQHVFQRYQGRDDLFKNHRVTHLVSQEQFEKAAAIQRVAYQKIWHVCYESKISSDNKDQRRIAMKVFLSLYDLGKILTCA